MIQREQSQKVVNLLKRHASVAILGPRQVGKTTLAFEVAKAFKHALYLDMASPADVAKMAEPELFLQEYLKNLVVIDEVQRSPEIFSILRGLIDKGRRNGKKTGRFLLLGSASIDLLRQSAESLAGRIIYSELTGFNLLEIGEKNANRLWLRGGFPDSYLAKNDELSFEWRKSFIKTYLERDIPQFGLRIPAETLRRFWTMLAHEQGGILNASKYASALGVSGQSVVRYLDLLCDLLLVRRLMPWYESVGKRLTKSPKIYIRDCGVVHALLNINNSQNLLAHPVAGHSWEGWIIEQILAVTASDTQSYFYRASGGAEVDLVLEFASGERWCIECMRSLTPAVTRGFHDAANDIKPKRKIIVYPGDVNYPSSNGIEVMNLPSVLAALKK